MKFVFLFLGCFFISTLNAQISTNYNLSFETMSGGNLPMGWQKFNKGEYDLGLDGKVKTAGRFAVKISSSGGNELGSSGLTFRIPNQFKGEEMELSGWIKTENVTGGFAGLMIRVDPSIAFDNMEEQAVSGTREWKHYRVKVKLKPESTEAIYIGIMLIGKGTAWFDDLHIKIDGRDYEDVLRDALPAINDTTYQYRSRIKKLEVSEEVVKRLKDLARVWGFLKYNHPNIAKGLFNMDAELFRLMPSVIAPCNDNSNADHAIRSFIEKLGKIEETPNLTTSNRPLKMKADYTWIDQLDYSTEIKEALRSFAERRYQLASHYYISTNKIGVPSFNEQSYPYAPLEDVGFRLLALFRYWNIVQYYSPYRYLIQNNWDLVLEEAIKDMVEAKTEMDVSKILLRLCASTEDSHAMIFQNKMSLRGFYGRRAVPVTLGFIERKAVVLSLPDDERFENVDLQVGDVIKSLNDTLVEDRVNLFRPYTGASNEDGILRNIARHLLCTNDTIVKIRIDRDGHDTVIIADTYPIQEFSTQSSKEDSVFRILPHQIAYLNHGWLMNSDLPRLWNSIQGCRGLIIDMRNYQKESHLDEVSHYLMPNSRPFAKFTHSSIDSAGSFWFTPNRVAGIENSDFFKGPVVILVNEMTQSSSEFHAMAYQQAPNTWTIGSQTAGADGNITMVQLPFDYKVILTGLGVYYPNDDETQQVGIHLDQKVKPTLDGIRAGKDELLERAVEYINRKSPSIL